MANEISVLIVPTSHHILNLTFLCGGNWIMRAKRNKIFIEPVKTEKCLIKENGISQCRLATLRDAALILQFCSRLTMLSQISCCITS